MKFTSYTAKIICLVVAFIVCFWFSISCISSANVLTKYQVLLITTSIVFYFLSLITFIQYIVFKEATYFYYIIYLLLNVCYFTVIIPSQPFSGIRFSIEVIEFLKYLPIPVLVLSYYMYVKFAINFLRLKITDKKTFYWLTLFSKIYLMLFAITALATLLMRNTVYYDAVKSVILILCMPIGIISIVIVYLRKQNAIATILCVGSLFFFAGSVLGFLISSNLLSVKKSMFPFNQWIFYTEMGTMLEAIMFFGSFSYRNKFILDTETKAKQKLQFVRNDIAKDLHDEIGSTLTSINILSQVSENIIKEQPQRAEEMLHQISTQSKTIQQNMSDIVWSLRQENDNVQSLVVRMREYAAQTLEPLNISIEVLTTNIFDEEKLPVQYRKEMLLVFKEATNNIAKHSGATAVIIQLDKTIKHIELSINDNGKWKGSNSGTGTKSMQERAEILGGTLSISTNKMGTQIKLIVPIP